MKIRLFRKLLILQHVFLQCIKSRSLYYRLVCAHYACLLKKSSVIILILEVLTLLCYLLSAIVLGCRFAVRSVTIRVQGIYLFSLILIVRIVTDINLTTVFVNCHKVVPYSCQLFLRRNFVKKNAKCNKYRERYSFGSCRIPHTSFEGELILYRDGII